MSLKRSILTAAQPAWFLVVMGATITVYSGNAEPYVSPSQLPRGPLYMFGGPVVLILVGVLVVQALLSSDLRKSWVAAGRRANLSPESGGLFGRPDLIGTVDGRHVRARTASRTRSKGDEQSGSTTTRFTFVETDLARPAEAGLVLAPDDGKITGEGGSWSFYLDRDTATVARDGLLAFGYTEEIARAILSGPAGDAVRNLDGINVVYVGNATEPVYRYLQDVYSTDSRVGSMLVDPPTGDDVDERFPGDAATVAVETVDLVLDGEKLRQQAAAAVAVADAFEEATVTA